MLGGNNTSALFELWMSAILKMRGVPESPAEVFRLKGGNQMLPNAFAKRLGARVRLNSAIQLIRHNDKGVTVTYKQNNKEHELTADFFVNCIPLPALKNVQFEPASCHPKNNISAIRSSMIPISGLCFRPVQNSGKPMVLASTLSWTIQTSGACGNLRKK